MKERLRLATSNAHKVEEIAAILAPLPLAIESLKELPVPIEEPEENGSTFAENALIKAKAYMQEFEGWVMADDSGLVVPALGGEPGIISARYAGEGASDADNRHYLSARLHKEDLVETPGYFVCCICLCKANEEPQYFEGNWHGVVRTTESGEGGFGYDSLFFLPELGATAAQLPAEEKNSISHRGLALQKLLAFFDER